MEKVDSSLPFAVKAFSKEVVYAQENGKVFCLLMFDIKKLKIVYYFIAIFSIMRLNVLSIYYILSVK